MRAGKLRERINIQAPTYLKTASGEESRSWATIQSCWAEVRSLTERSYTGEDMQAMQVNSQASYDFHCRGLTGVTTTMRVVFEGRIFDIVAVIQERLLGEKTILHCLERQDNDNDY